jgi:hypothetical protein
MTQGKNTCNKPKKQASLKSYYCQLSYYRIQNWKKYLLAITIYLIHRILVCKQKNIKKVTVTAINITCTEGKITFQQRCGADAGARAERYVINLALGAVITN